MEEIPMGEAIVTSGLRDKPKTSRGMSSGSQVVILFGKK